MKLRSELGISMYFLLFKTFIIDFQKSDHQNDDCNDQR